MEAPLSARTRKALAPEKPPPLSIDSRNKNSIKSPQNSSVSVLTTNLKFFVVVIFFLFKFFNFTFSFPVTRESGKMADRETASGKSPPFSYWISSNYTPFDSCLHEQTNQPSTILLNRSACSSLLIALQIRLIAAPTDSWATILQNPARGNHTRSIILKRS